MSSLVAIPTSTLWDPSGDPEHYELLNDCWEKKESVGRKDHSATGRVVYHLFRPVAMQLGCKLELEWTIVQEGKKIIPDVTL